jgi:hypothetical protein
MTNIFASLAAAACMAHAGEGVVPSPDDTELRFLVPYSRVRSLLTEYVNPDRKVRRQSYKDWKTLKHMLCQLSIYKVIDQKTIVLSIREVKTCVRRVCEVAFFNSAYTK